MWPACVPLFLFAWFKDLIEDKECLCWSLLFPAPVGGAGNFIKPWPPIIAGELPLDPSAGDELEGRVRFNPFGAAPRGLPPTIGLDDLLALPSPPGDAALKDEGLLAPRPGDACPMVWAWGCACPSRGDGRGGLCWPVDANWGLGGKLLGFLWLAAFGDAPANREPGENFGDWGLATTCPTSGLLLLLFSWVFWGCDGSSDWVGVSVGWESDVSVSVVIVGSDDDILSMKWFDINRY